MSHIKIEMTGPYTGKVWVDGVELEKVTSVGFDVSVLGRARPAHVTIEQTLWADEFSFCGQADVTVLDNKGARMYRPAMPEPAEREDG